ncbi:MAG: FG-GAP-like repeat-containing protein, partial [Planctomycetota bacterium]|nr:FG-GAP-like repeat-containing protein [Planctomycetota bacterium]
WDNAPGPQGPLLSLAAPAFLGVPALGSGLAVGDVDRDGSPDLVVGPGSAGGGAPAPGRVRRGVGGGHSPPRSRGGAGAATAGQLVLADFDLDGDLDLVVAMSADAHTGVGGSPDRLLWNDGAGGFVEDLAFTNAAFNDPILGTTSLAVGDINQDGAPELFLGKSDPIGQQGVPGEQNRLVYIFGPGSFFDLTSLSMPAIEDNTNDLTLVDVDLDGDLDLVAANTRSSVPANASGDLLINQGGDQGGAPGSFLDVADPGLEAVASQVIRLGVVAFDADNDGDSDLLFTTHDLPPGSLQPLYLNQGGAQGGSIGSFALASWFDPGDLIVEDACVTDLDRDGDLDLLLPSTGSLSGDPAGSDLHLFLGQTAL